jgi:hypothetical protein
MQNAAASSPTRTARQLIPWLPSQTPAKIPSAPGATSRVPRRRELMGHGRRRPKQLGP